MEGSHVSMQLWRKDSHDSLYTWGPGVLAGMLANVKHARLKSDTTVFAH
jgi:hypothetical protein